MSETEPEVSAAEAPADPQEPAQDVATVGFAVEQGANRARGVTRAVASPAGSKVVPAVSIILILVGIGLVVASFLGSSVSPLPVVTGPTAPAQLEAAMAIAKEAMVREDPNSFRGFKASNADPLPDGVSWKNGGPAEVGKVSIYGSGRTGIVLVTKDGATGGFFCIADDNADDEVTKGTADVDKPFQCLGGWPTG